MPSVEPAIYFSLFLGAILFDVGVAVAAPRFYWNCTFRVFRKPLDQGVIFSFDDLPGIKEANPGWTVKWIAADDERFRIGFRERFWGLTSLYTPIIHGELVDSQNRLSLLGRLGWFYPCFSVVFLRMAWEFAAPDFVVALVLITAILFLIQRYRFMKVADRCLDLARKGTKNA